jgi:hypothetical protein
MVYAAIIMGMAHIFDSKAASAFKSLSSISISYLSISSFAVKQRRCMYNKPLPVTDPWQGEGEVNATKKTPMDQTDHNAFARLFLIRDIIFDWNENPGFG